MLCIIDILAMSVIQTRMAPIVDVHRYEEARAEHNIASEISGRATLLDETGMVDLWCNLS